MQRRRSARIDRTQVLPPEVIQASAQIARAIVDAIALLTPQAATPATARFVTIALASQRTGYTETAIRRKMDRGDWLAGREYVKAPDGSRLVDMLGYEAWATRGR